MPQEVMISVEKNVRIVVDNFYFRVETRSYRGWTRAGSFRSLTPAIHHFDGLVGFRQALAATPV